jgi:hypothetical protein
MSILLECLIFFPHIKMLLCVSIFLHPLVLRWILSYCIRSCLGSSSHEYDDISSIIPIFYIDPLNILVSLVPLFLNISQKCSTFFCVMVCCTIVHTCHWWEWIFPCIMSWMLEVVAHYWSSTSSKSSSTSSSTFVSNLISLWCIVLRYLIIMCEVLQWLHSIVLWLCSVVLWLCNIIWRWYLVEMRCIFPCHHFYFHPIGI